MTWSDFHDFLIMGIRCDVWGQNLVWLSTKVSLYLVVFILFSVWACWLVHGLLLNKMLPGAQHVPGLPSTRSWIIAGWADPVVAWSCSWEDTWGNKEVCVCSQARQTGSLANPGSPQENRPWWCSKCMGVGVLHLAALKWGKGRVGMSRALMSGAFVWGTQSWYHSSAPAPSWSQVVWCYPAPRGSEIQGNLRASTEGCLCVLKVKETYVDKAQVLGSHQVYKAKRSSHIREHKCLEALMGDIPSYQALHE